jgi:hypothetical protein
LFKTFSVCKSTTKSELFHNEPSQLINIFITLDFKEKKISLKQLLNKQQLKPLLVSVSNGVDKKTGWGRC